jgi:hypothetical protein
MTRTSTQRGIALLAVIMITSLVGALTAVLVFVITTESRVGANQQAAQFSGYAAVAGMERVIAELRRLPAWDLVPSSSSTALDFNDGAAAVRLADGTALSLVRLTAERQASSNAFYPGVPDRPVWTLYAHASLSRIIADDAVTPDPYVIVWVADDADEEDGDPARDSNEAVLVRAEAFGARGGWRAVEATLSSAVIRDAAGTITMRKVTVIAWREVR